MEEKKEKNNEAAATTTTSPLSKSEVNRIEKLKKSIKDSNPKKLEVKSHDEVTPIRSEVKSHDEVPPIKSEVNGQINDRSTTWTFIVYIDSAPENWIKILKGLHVPFVISPLHNKDVRDPETGELKKPHYHCIIRFRSKKSFKQVKSEICDKLNGPIPQPVGDFSMMVRYLVHLDDPDKYQYKKEDIKVYGNIDVNEYIYSKKEYQFEMLKEILDFCEKFDIQEYSTIVNYAKDEHPSWFPYVTKIFRSAVDSYVRSQRYASENGTY